MNRPTLGQLRASSFPAAAGLCANDPRVTGIANEAQERLLHDPMAPDEGWWGGWARMRFSVGVSNRTGYIITPREVARVIGVQVCQSPIRMRNGFYEYLQFSAGLQPKNTCAVGTTTCCTSNLDSPTEAYERETTPTLADLSADPQYVRVYPVDARDVGKRVCIQGEDQNEATILGTDITTGSATLGEWITVTLPFAVSTNQFSAITGVQKDVTYGEIQLYQVDVTTGAELPLSTMEPGETEGNYRKYMLNGLPANCCNTSTGTVQVDAMVKLDFIPAASDTDYLLIQSIPALIEECKAIRHGAMDDPEMKSLAEKEHAAAMRLLFGQLDHYQGKTQTAIGFRLFGSGGLRQQAR